MSDAQLKAQGATVKFGLDQLGNQTPMWAKWINRVITGIIGIYGIVINVTGNTWIPVALQDQINKIVIMIPMVTLYLSKMVGWDLSGSADTDKP